MAAPPISISPRQFEFAEMNLIHSGSPALTLKLAQRAVLMGYDTFVINRDIGDHFAPELHEDDEPEEPQPKKKKKQKNAVGIPDPFLVDLSKIDSKQLENNGRRLRQFSRLTVTLNDADYVHNLFMDPQVKKYDLLAIRPGDLQIFNILQRKCDSFDIITYEATERVEWMKFSRQIRALQKEGVSFEITYVPALGDSHSRRMVLANGRSLFHSLANKGIIFASGARDVIDIRGPYDAMNMLTLFGIKPSIAKTYLSAFQRLCLLRCESKHSVKGAVAVHSLDNVPSSALAPKCALQRLLQVPEFRAQIEKLPPRPTPAEDPATMDQA
ncbi:unnamed protein product, partial [Mesorhabditis spiculigera]